MPTALDTSINYIGPFVDQADQKIWIAALRSALAEMGDPMSRFGAIQNLGFSLSVNASALTIALKDRALANPSADSPVSASFRNVTPATGDSSVLNLAAAHSLVVSSGSTLGTRNGIPFRLWFVAFNDAGTWRLGVINCVTTVAGAGSGSDVTKIYPLSAWGIDSSTAEGGAGAADSAQTFYTGTAVSAKAYVVLGYATWETGLATAGTWSSGPTRVQPFGPGVPLPDQSIQKQRVVLGTVVTGNAAVLPADNSIPQSGEGNQLMSTQGITPSSAANVLAVKHQGNYSNDGAAAEYACSIFQDAVANALATSFGTSVAANTPFSTSVGLVMLAGTTSTTTFKARIGNAANNTFAINGIATGAVQRYGGVLASTLEIEEVMG